MALRAALEATRRDMQQQGDSPLLNFVVAAQALLQ